LIPYAGPDAQAFGGQGETAGSQAGLRWYDEGGKFARDLVSLADNRYQREPLLRPLMRGERRVQDHLKLAANPAHAKDHLARSKGGRLRGYRRSVLTPATVIRYTGNWQGSMEGWLMTPATGPHQLHVTLPGLGRFLIAGQWVAPGGGLPDA
jgi:phytoene dehydrogenase-like protein